jgi:hypothetical protein
VDTTLLAALVGGSIASVVIAFPLARLLRIPAGLSRWLLFGVRPRHTSTLRARASRTDPGALVGPVLVAIGAYLGLAGALAAMTNPPAAASTALLAGILGATALSAVSLLLPGVLARRRAALDPIHSPVSLGDSFTRAA